MVCDNNQSYVKCISFKLSRVRFVTHPEIQHEELVVTGSWMEERNRLCLWQYEIDDEKIKPISEDEDGKCAGVLGDSADDPRLLGSLVHPGSVQDLKVHHISKCVISASSNGSLHLYRVNSSHPCLTHLTTTDWFPFGYQTTSGNLPISLSSISVSSDGEQVYIANDLGQLAAVSVERIPNASANSAESKISKAYDPIIMHGADISTVNALQRVDNSSLVTVNQLGQLKLWDLRTNLSHPQRRLLRPGEMHPLLCIAHHPGQAHLLAVGGMSGSSAPAYVWDLRAEQYPLTEVDCDGRIVWEAAFHPRQPKHLYLATETAGLLRISSRDDAESWTGFHGSRRKLTVSSALSVDTNATNVISFDLTNTKLVCGHSDAVLQTVPCNVTVY